GPVVARWFLGPSYWFGAKLMMTLAGAHVFYVAGSSIVPVFLAAKRSSYILCAYVAAAVLNISLNLIFIPRFGILAAAASTAAAYILWTASLAVAANRLLERMILADADPTQRSSAAALATSRPDKSAVL